VAQGVVGGRLGFLFLICLMRSGVDWNALLPRSCESVSTRAAYGIAGDHLFSSAIYMAVLAFASKVSLPPRPVASESLS
jgi:hypothetical protein